MNSKQAFDETEKLANSLLERTKDGKIEWVVADVDEFIYPTPTGIDFLVSGSASDYGFKMRDGQGHELISILTRPDKEYWELADGEKVVYKLLPDLYDAARRSALKVDQQVNQISEYLQNL